MLKRIKNLWKLSGMDLPPKKEADILDFLSEVDNPVIKPPKMAQIIKRTKDPIEDIINGN